MVPSQLFAGNPALKESFDTACEHQKVEMYLSNVEDKMVCYRFKCALPIYALADVDGWESAYELLNPDLDVLLHTNTGNDPDFSRETGVPWADRPPVTYKKDVRLPGANGLVSREGRYFNEVVDPLFAQALQMGLILPVQEGTAPDERYTFECLVLDKNGWDYSFDAAEYRNVPGAVIDGMLQKGKPIAEYFARKKSAAASTCIRKIELLGLDAFKKPMPWAIAEDRAKRILRKNTPLFIHLKRSMPVMQAVSAAIDEANKISLSGQMIPTFAKSIAFNILREDADHFWKIHLGGRPTQLCRMVSASYESGSDAVLYEKGFRVKLLFDSFINVTDEHADVIKAVNEVWQPLLDNQAPMQQDYLDFLQWAKDEADARMAGVFCGRPRDGKATTLPRTASRGRGGRTNGADEGVVCRHSACLQQPSGIGKEVTLSCLFKPARCAQLARPAGERKNGYAGTVGAQCNRHDYGCAFESPGRIVCPPAGDGFAYV